MLFLFCLSKEEMRVKNLSALRSNMDILMSVLEVFGAFDLRAISLINNMKYWKIW